VIGIIDIGIGTPKSVFNAFKFLGIDSALVTIPKHLNKFEKIVLPGVGNFGAFSFRLAESGFSEEINKTVHKLNTPFLGICVGAQMLLNKSAESAKELGLGLIPGSVIHVDAQSGQKVPNVGWRKIKYFNEKNPEFKPEYNKFYFSHSYQFDVLRTYLLAETINFKTPAIIKRECIIGVQFHPEKSGNFGLNFLNDFASK
jgi:glutamine amidotransferase